MALKSPSGSRLVPSTTCTSTRERRQCRRNSWPSPRPECAPSSSPARPAAARSLPACGRRARAGRPQRMISITSAEGRTRDVREDGGAEVQLADAQVGHERGERVVGHLGPRGRHDAQQRGLARVGHAHDADVRHQLQLQVGPHLRAGLAVLRQRRRAARGTRRPGQDTLAPGACAAGPPAAERAPCCPRWDGRACARGAALVPAGLERRVAAAAAAAHRQQRALARHDQLGQRRLAAARVAPAHDRAGRHGHLQVGAGAAVPARAAARAARRRAEVHLLAKGGQRVERRVGHRPHGAAVAAVAAGRAACAPGARARGRAGGRTGVRRRTRGGCQAAAGARAPFGTYFSRRNATQPRPPSPPFTKMRAVSKQRISAGSRRPATCSCARSGPRGGRRRARGGGRAPRLPGALLRLLKPRRLERPARLVHPCRVPVGGVLLTGRRLAPLGGLGGAAGLNDTTLCCHGRPGGRVARRIPGAPVRQRGTPAASACCTACVQLLPHRGRCRRRGARCASRAPRHGRRLVAAGRSASLLGVGGERRLACSLPALTLAVPALWRQAKVP